MKKECTSLVQIWFTEIGIELSVIWECESISKIHENQNGMPEVCVQFEIFKSWKLPTLRYNHTVLYRSMLN